jgi:tagaturonate epimerase
LPPNLKISVHSGSDKFSIYPVINKVIKKFDAGLHLKTAGTTWLEEIIGLAASGGEGLNMVKEIYKGAYRRFDELCEPYNSVIKIDRRMLPHPDEVASWTKKDYIEVVQHNQACKRFNTHFRQLVHIGYKIAAEDSKRFMHLLSECRDMIELNVTENIFDRHIRPLFIGQKG